MKKQPKAVYIIENGGYTELSYEEFRRREQICPLYADKLFLPLYGSLMEVSKEDYEEYYRQRNRQIYIDRRASRNGDVSSFVFKRGTLYCSNSFSKYPGVSSPLVMTAAAGFSESHSETTSICFSRLIF